MVGWFLGLVDAHCLQNSVFIYKLAIVRLCIHSLIGQGSKMFTPWYFSRNSLCRWSCLLTAWTTELALTRCCTSCWLSKKARPAQFRVLRQLPVLNMLSCPVGTVKGERGEEVQGGKTTFERGRRVMEDWIKEAVPCMLRTADSPSLNIENNRNILSKALSSWSWFLMTVSISLCLPRQLI